jgi:hypothetical protein
LDISPDIFVAVPLSLWNLPYRVLLLHAFSGRSAGSVRLGFIMGLWSRVTGKLRTRGVLSEDPEPDGGGDEPRARVPLPTPTGRVPQRPHETPTTHIPDTPHDTAGTRRYGSQGGTPSTERLHNPRHFR